MKIFLLYLLIFRPKLYEEEINDKEEASCDEDFYSAQCDKFSDHICHQHSVSRPTFSTWVNMSYGKRKMFEWNWAAFVAHLCWMFWQVTILSIREFTNHQFDKVLKGSRLSSDQNSDRDRQRLLRHPDLPAFVDRHPPEVREDIWLTTTY